MKKINQNDRIIRHLKDYKTITSWEAIQEYGVTRLSARIRDIKDMGYNIDSEWMYDINRYGESVKYKRYELVWYWQEKFNYIQ